MKAHFYFKRDIEDKFQSNVVKISIESFSSKNSEKGQNTLTPKIKIENI